MSQLYGSGLSGPGDTLGIAYLILRRCIAVQEILKPWHRWGSAPGPWDMVAAVTLMACVSGKPMSLAAANQILLVQQCS